LGRSYEVRCEHKILACVDLQEGERQRERNKKRESNRGGGGERGKD